MRPTHFRTAFFALLIWQFISVTFGQTLRPGDTPPITIIETGKPIERSLKGGERHQYSFSIEADRFASLVPAQPGMDFEIWRTVHAA